jgi:hypothetical protein
MQVSRASATATRTASVRTDAARGDVPDTVSGIAPIEAAENGLANGEREPQQPPFADYFERDDHSPERLIDAIDPALAYRAATSLLRRQGMVGLLLNRNA